MDFLRLLLAGFEIQSISDFEIIISDDGSNKTFVDELNHIMASTKLSIRHNWHPDTGFRKNLVLNSSVKSAAAGYLIFVDGDCIPHPHFVEEHLNHAEKGVCLMGRRVMLSERITKKLSADVIRKGMLQSPRMLIEMLWDYFRIRLFHFKKGIYIKNPLLRKYVNRKKDRGILGSNFSLYKSDLLAVNGFDERYQAAGYGEDTDLELRLRLNNMRFKTLMNIAVQYHCYHKLLPRLEQSRLVFELAKQEKRAFTPYGIEKGNE
jgi:glycosyltransferase involved in cell wall biosynthesis